MSDAAAIRIDEVLGLRRCMRDLVALTALPEAWRDLEPGQVAEGLATVLEGTVSLEFLLVRVQALPDHPPYEVIRAHDKEQRTLARVRAICDPLLARPTLHGRSPPETVADPLGGTLRVASIPLGVGGDFGGIVAASADRNFPTEIERLLLSIAANQAATVLQRRRAEQELRQSQRELSDFVENATVGLHWVGPDGRILWANQAELDLLGFTRDEYIGRHIAEFHADPPVIEEILRCLSNGETLVDYEARIRCKDGSIRHVLINSNVLWDDGKFIHTRCFTRDITALKRTERELAERALQAEFGAHVAAVLTSGDPLRTKLQRCAEALAHFQDAAFARIWMLNEAEQVLELQASAGMYTHLDGQHGRVPIGRYKIGLIARERRPILTNNVAHDPHISDRDWARRERMVAFAGYPLIVGERLVGVMGLFARHALSEATLRALESVADGIALGIDQSRAERERGELLLREQEARARAETERTRLYELFMQAPAAICVLQGPDHVFELANSRYQELVGGRNILGRPVREALPEVEGQGFLQLLDGVFATGTPHVGTEVPVIIDRGEDTGAEELYVNFIYQPIRDWRGSIEGIFVHSVDVTEPVRARRRVEALAAENAQLYLQADRAARAREAERDRLKQVIEALPEGIAIGDERGRVVVSNAAARAIWGGPPPEVGVDVYGAFGVARLDGSSYPSEELPLARSILRGEVVQGDQFLIRNAATGEMIPVLVNSAPLRDPNGEIVGGVVVFQDISALKELERQKDEFLAAASHDLKNPLANIKGRAQLLQRRVARLNDPESGRLLDGLRQIDLGASRATTMINELLDLTRLQMGRSLDLDCQPMDLVALARQVVAEYQQTTDRHAIELCADVPSLQGTWDPQRLERVLANLLSNAIKYSPAGGVVTVTAVREEDSRGRWAILRVHDRGIGVPEQDLPAIFGRFYRGSNVAGKIGGTGLGLAGAKQIVELHGGTMSVESEPGAGSTFAVWLPLSADEAKTS